MHVTAGLSLVPKGDRVCIQVRGGGKPKKMRRHYYSTSWHGSQGEEARWPSGRASRGTGRSPSAPSPSPLTFTALLTSPMTFSASSTRPSRALAASTVFCKFKLVASTCWMTESDGNSHLRDGDVTMRRQGYIDASDTPLPSDTPLQPTPPLTISYRDHAIDTVG